MSIHFYDVENKKSPIFDISDKDISKYSDVIDLFNSKYNDLFDFYGNFYLYTNHIDFLIQEAKKQNLYRNNFLVFLEEVKSKKIDIYVVGD